MSYKWRLICCEVHYTINHSVRTDRKKIDQDRGVIFLKQGDNCTYLIFVME
jgi:hypothetical protein